MEVDGTTLPVGERALLEEARRQRLGKAPDPRSAMQAVDAAAIREQLMPFLEGHYGHFALSSQHLHVHLDGPALFREDTATGEMVIFVEPRILLGFASLRYGAYYFALATQGIALLAGLDDISRFRHAEVQRVRRRGPPGDGAPCSGGTSVGV
jgi:hypothetical protein